jgi:hypothetical protein
MTPNTTNETPGRSGWTLIAVVLAVLAFATILVWHNIADGDLWARLAAGASIHFTGHVWARDVFAFTPTLTRWVDHEWGAGVVFFTVLDWWGPGGLMTLKVLLAFTALGLALATGRQAGLTALLIMSVPCAWALLPGYVPVIRSHAFTYAFFALTLWVSNRIYNGQTRLWPALPLIMMVWVNLHGGFVTGFVVMGAHLIAAVIQRGAWRPLLQGTVAAVAVTVFTPYATSFYSYLIPALLHPRPRITEWGPMPLLGWDAFTGFRVAFVIALAILPAAWNRLEARQRKGALPGLILLALTAWVAWQHRRHAPFFGLVAAAVLPVYLQALLNAVPGGIRARMEPALALSLTLAATGLITLRLLPGLSTQVLAPVGLFPVRECDILARAGVSGNLAVPFDWGSYAAWRLYPRIKISMDGRYEETFPESSFEMNERFYNREGEEWNQLIRSHTVDFVVIDRRHTNLTPSDMVLCGFEPVWNSELSSLWAKTNAMGALRQAVATLPDTTIQPLDARIPAAWPWPSPDPVHR